MEAFPETGTGSKKFYIQNILSPTPPEKPLVLKDGNFSNVGVGNARGIAGWVPASRVLDPPTIITLNGKVKNLRGEIPRQQKVQSVWDSRKS